MAAATAHLPRGGSIRWRLSLKISLYRSGSGFQVASVVGKLAL